MEIFVKNRRRNRMTLALMWLCLLLSCGAAVGLSAYIVDTLYLTVHGFLYPILAGLVVIGTIVVCLVLTELGLQITKGLRAPESELEIQNRKKEERERLESGEEEPQEWPVAQRVISLFNSREKNNGSF